MTSFRSISEPALGVGDAQLNFGSLSLRSVDLAMGAGTFRWISAVLPAKIIRFAFAAESARLPFICPGTSVYQPLLREELATSR